MLSQSEYLPGGLIRVCVLPRYLNSYLEWLSTGLGNFSTASAVEKMILNVLNFMYSGLAALFTW